MAGQSNMVGYGTSAEDLPPRWRKVLGDAQILRYDDWVPLRAEGGYQRRGFGPELAFANDWQGQTGRAVRIVKVARTATFLAREWSPDEEPGSLYNRLVTRARRAMLSDTMRLRGLLWMQGEADALEEETAQAYHIRFERFVKRLRRDIGAPDLPVVAGLIDPPEAEFPHAATVRAALAGSTLRDYATVECDDLPRRRDGLHFSPRGLSMLGRRFAAALHQLDSARRYPAPCRRWLHVSDQYHCWYEGPEAEPEAAVVSLPHAVAGDGFDEIGFGQPYFLSRGIPAVYVRHRQSNWFQDEEIMAVAARVRAHLPRARLVTYGASMGGYGALLLSAPLRAEKALSIAPQYSIDRAVVPWEKRWKQAAKRTGPFIHRLEDHVAPQARKVVLYDPLCEDRRQVAMFETDESWEIVAIPLASHQVLQRLLDSEALPLVLHNLFGDGPDTEAIRAAARARRRDSKIYWLSLALGNAERRPAVAEAAIERCVELGGPKRKLNRIRATLAEAGQARAGGRKTG